MILVIVTQARPIIRLKNYKDKENPRKMMKSEQNSLHHLKVITSFVHNNRTNISLKSSSQCFSAKSILYILEISANRL